MIKHCFIDSNRPCNNKCVAFIEDTRGSTACRVLNTLEKLVPIPTRPTPPAAPKV